MFFAASRALRDITKTSASWSLYTLEHASQFRMPSKLHTRKPRGPLSPKHEGVFIFYSPGQNAFGFRYSVSLMVPLTGGFGVLSRLTGWGAKNVRAGPHGPTGVCWSNTSYVMSHVWPH